MRILLLFGIFMLAITGCANNSRNDASPPPNHQDKRIHVQQTASSDRKEIKNSGKVADRLEKLAKSLPNVKDATCVVIGNTAIVGIDVDGKLDRGRVGTIKYSVAEALRKDPYGKYAIVTADIDVRNRLLEIRSDLRKGRPLAGFAEELADIVGRIIPQLPRDTAPKAEPQGHPDDRKKLNNKSLVQ